LPRDDRRELVSEIRAHLSEAIDSDVTEAEALTVLDRLGEPEEIVDAQQPHGPATANARGVHEWAAIFLLLFGGFVFGIGWLAGVVLLWSSRAWTLRDKLIGTLVVPGGLAAVVFGLGIGSSSQLCYSTSGGGQHCTGGPSSSAQILAIAIVAILVLAPIATAVYLARRAG
jgi:hypothetical protein